MLNFNDGLPAIIQPDHATIKSRDRTQLTDHFRAARLTCWPEALVEILLV
jgi:hypothetical protein